MVVAGSVSGAAFTRSLLITQRLFLTWPGSRFLGSMFPCVYPRYQITNLQDIEIFCTKTVTRTLQKSAPKNKSFKISMNCMIPESMSCLRRSLEILLLRQQYLTPSPCSVPITHSKLLLRKKYKTVNKTTQTVWCQLTHLYER